jgi:HSP20 family protein
MSIKDLIKRNSKNKLTERPTSADSLLDMHRDFNRVFEEFFGDFGSLTDWSGADTTLAKVNPRTDISESDKEVTVTAELPGMSQKDVNVELANDTLTISGEKKTETEQKGKHWYRMERSSGSFHRSIMLPADVDTGKASARMKDGVLTVIIPKTAGEKAHKHKIEVAAE